MKTGRVVSHRLRLYGTASATLSSGVDAPGAGNKAVFSLEPPSTMRGYETVANPKPSGRLRPMNRTSTKVPSPLLRKARMIAVARDLKLEDYVETVLRPAIERDYHEMFIDEKDE
jgi:hypothetical protein